MRLTGQGIWGEPADRAECVRVVQRAVELGVDLIDTADSLRPVRQRGDHPRGAAPVPGAGARRHQGRAGAARPGHLAAGRPARVPAPGGRDEPAPARPRAHRPVPAAPHRPEGAARGPDRRARRAAGRGQDRRHRAFRGDDREIDEVRKIADIATVQNLYNLTNRKSEDVVDYCTRESIGFIPWFPIAAGKLPAEGGPVDEIAKDTGATPAQVALAWLLARAQIILPIPGTSSVAHLEENVARGAGAAHPRAGRRAHRRGRPQ